MKISDYIIISDVDGTLLPYGGEIPRRNIEALERFTAKGGKFSIATGRSRELTEEFVKTLPVNAPCVLYNGGGLYDYDKKEFYMQMFLPESAKKDVETICKDMPGASVLVIADSSYYHVSQEIPFALANFTDTHRMYMKEALINSITSQWYKVLFSTSEEDTPVLDKYIAGSNFNGIRFVRTNPTLLELLPAAANKGFAIEKLVELGLFKREGIAAVGDFYNDVEMIEYAAIGAATAEAPDDVKAKADFITGPCDNGAVADLVEYIEQQCEQFEAAD